MDGNIMPTLDSTSEQAEEPKRAFGSDQRPEDVLSEIHCLITELESVTNKNKRAELIRESVKPKIAVLDAKLRENEEHLEAINSTIKELENRLKEKQHLLSSRDAQIEERNLLIKAKSEENKRMSSEIEKLKSRLKQKEMFLVAKEKAMWRSIARRNFWKRLLPPVLQ